ncbi:hypothetical protein TcWFU_008761 [Taenia crassiceps]|uniref:Nucleoporin NUP42 n=1 Tax=Taenia crassiceps TaxID=6207 RepID=A0ABR4QAA5_9CEST
MENSDILQVGRMYSAVCRHFLAGYCRNGEDCIFIHANPNYKPRPSYNYSVPRYERNFPRNPGAPRICRFFQMGYCAYGAGCGFLHPRNKALNTPQQLQKGVSTRSPALTAQPDRFHFRKSIDAESTSVPTFSFRKTFESLLPRDTGDAGTAVLTEQQYFGYKGEEVFSTKENLSVDDLKIYSETGEDGFSFIPLLPPPEELCF